MNVKKIAIIITTLFSNIYALDQNIALDCSVTNCIYNQDLNIDVNSSYFYGVRVSNDNNLSIDGNLNISSKTIGLIFESTNSSHIETKNINITSNK